MSELGDKILALRYEGNTYDQIRAETGASKGTIAYYCGEKQREKSLRRNAVARWERYRRLDAIKSVPCLDCGGNFPPVCMDFDHVRGDKIGSIAQLVITGTWQGILDEIEKCEIVCANCHRVRTQNRGRDGWRTQAEMVV